MENFYTAYTKVVQNTTFYFVKKYTRFPEYIAIPGILENYGMHTDFIRACEIAGIRDEDVQKKLREDLQAIEPDAKVIHMNMDKAIRAFK